MHRYGVALIVAAPDNEEASVRFGEEVFGYMEPSVYGRYSPVISEAKANPRLGEMDDIANMAVPLELHTDQPYLQVGSVVCYALARLRLIHRPHCRHHQASSSCTASSRRPLEEATTC